MESLGAEPDCSECLLAMKRQFNETLSDAFLAPRLRRSGQREALPIDEQGDFPERHHGDGDGFDRPSLVNEPARRAAESMIVLKRPQERVRVEQQHQLSVAIPSESSRFASQASISAIVDPSKVSSSS